MPFLANHRQRTEPVKRYRQVAADIGSVRAHRVRAARALGRPLPTGAVVHHVDGTTSEGSPLLICQDEAYHKALHRRMRVRAYGGDPWTDRICGTCQTAKPFGAFSSPSATRCRGCAATAMAARRTRPCPS